MKGCQGVQSVLKRENPYPFAHAPYILAWQARWPISGSRAKWNTCLTNMRHPHHAVILQRNAK